MTNEAQVELSDTEVLNNSTDEDVQMAVDNEVAENDNSSSPDLEAQAEGNDEHKNQAKEIKERENPVASDDPKPQCQICEENEAVVAFKPCGHTVVCIGDLPLLFWCCCFKNCHKYMTVKFLVCLLFLIKKTGFSVNFAECAPRLKRCLECKTVVTGKGMRGNLHKF